MSKWLLVLAFALISGTPLHAQDAPPKTDDKKEAPKTDEKDEKKFANPVPGKCPVMPDEDADPDIHAEVNGKTYSFCCNKCVRAFQANPDKYLKKDAKKDEKKEEKK